MALFELLLCGMIGHKQLDVKDVWGGSDKFVFVVYVFMSILTVIFVALYLHFILMKQPKIVKENIR